MDTMLRKALRQYAGLRQQVENVLLGSDGDVWEAELKKFLAKRPCWIPDTKSGKPSKKQASKTLTFPDAINWSKVYHKLGMEAEFIGALPDLDREEKDGLWWVPVLKGVTPNKVVQAIRDLGVNVYLYTNDLNKDVAKNDRNPANGSYVARFQRTIETDPELANLSAEMLAERGIKGTTLLERLLLELAYFLETGEHLDVENVTLCSGSRRSGGRVPSVYWHAVARELFVSWRPPDERGDRLRARAVVSLPAEASAKAG